VLNEVILHRRSCRTFTDRPIPYHDLIDLARAGTYAPSGSNAQNQRFLLITEKEEIRRLGSIRWVWPYPTRRSRKQRILDVLRAASASRRHRASPLRYYSAKREKQPNGIIGNATAIILVFADSALTNQRNNGEYYLWETLEVQNCAASIQNILLLAAAKGIGSCWISCSEQMNHTRLLTGHSWRRTLANYQIPQSYKIQGTIILGYPKRYDAKGYPKGEGYHGVSRIPTKRKPVDDYMIQKNADAAPSLRLYGLLANLRLRCYSTLLHLLLFAIRRLDKGIYRVETKSINKSTKASL